MVLPGTVTVFSPSSLLLCLKEDDGTCSDAASLAKSDYQLRELSLWLHELRVLQRMRGVSTGQVSRATQPEPQQRKCTHALTEAERCYTVLHRLKPCNDRGFCRCTMTTCPCGASSARWKRSSIRASPHSSACFRPVAGMVQLFPGDCSELFGNFSQQRTQSHILTACSGTLYCHHSPVSCRFFLFTHIDFDIKYNADRVIEINVSTDPQQAVDISEGVTEQKVKFTYSVGGSAGQVDRTLT